MTSRGKEIVAEARLKSSDLIVKSVDKLLLDARSIVMGSQPCMISIGQDSAAVCGNMALTSTGPTAASLMVAAADISSSLCA
jgi:predicted MFS family arabinose efflux permease